MNNVDHKFFTETPIEHIPNPESGRLWDDDGYDQLPVKESEEPMVDLRAYLEAHGAKNMKFHPVYAGFDAVTGERDESQALPGTVGERMFVRESVAAGYTASQLVLDQMDMGFVFTDAYRSAETQSSGFTKTLMEMLEKEGASGADLKAFYSAAKKASKFFSAIKIHTEGKEGAEFLAAKADLLSTPIVKKTMEEIAKETGSSLDEVMANYLKFCANIEFVRKHFPNAPQTPLNVTIPLDYDNSTHPTGGSVDKLIHSNGVIATPAGFDCFEPEGGMLALEKASFEELKKRYCELPELRAHCKKQFNIEPEKLDQHHYDLMKAAMRALYHVTNRAGATHYIDEFQHKQFGNIVRNPLTGEIVHKGRATDLHPEAGNSCHSIQTMAHDKAVAIYGGLFAKRDVEDRLL